jgi:hypothetical protein
MTVNHANGPQAITTHIKSSGKYSAMVCRAQSLARPALVVNKQTHGMVSWNVLSSVEVASTCCFQRVASMYL